MSIEFDKKAYLGILLMLLLASKRPNTIQPSSLLARELCISKSYLQQIGKPLREHNLINSHRGPGGGYSLAKSVEKISITDVIRALIKLNFDAKKDIYSEEYILWINISNGLLYYLDALSIKMLVPKKPLTNQHEFPQRDRFFYLQKLII